MNITASINEFYIELKCRGYADKTQYNYRVDLTSFSKFLKRNGVTDTSEITLPIIKLGIQEQLDRGLKPSAINTYFKRIKVYVDYIYKCNYGGFDTRGVYPKLKEEKALIKTFTPEHVKTILASCGNGNASSGKRRDSWCDARDYLIMCLAFDLGLRNSEIRLLKKEQIFPDYILIKGKGAKERIAFLTPVCQKAMIKYQTATEEWFKERQMHSDTYLLTWRGNTLTTRDMNDIFKRRCVLIKEEGLRKTPHDARHTFAQMKLKSGVDVYSLSVLLGHEDVKTTTTYLRSISKLSVAESQKNNSIIMNL